MIPVKGFKNLYRDENTNAILNCNQNEYEEYLKIKNKKINEKNEINELKEEIENLKNIISDILSTLHK